MNEQSTKLNVFKKLVTIQSQLKAPKNQRNNFGNYNYRSCEDILEAVKPLLLETKTIVNLSDEVFMYGNPEGATNRFYVKATATFIDTETGESISSTAFAREEESKKGMDGSQITGASSSYARKYALNGLFGIDDNKDSDVTNTHGKESKQTTTGASTNTASAPAGTPASPKQMEVLKKLFDAGKISNAPETYTMQTASIAISNYMKSIGK